MSTTKPWAAVKRRLRSVAFAAPKYGNAGDLLVLVGDAEAERLRQLGAPGDERPGRGLGEIEPKRRSRRESVDDAAGELAGGAFIGRAAVAAFHVDARGRAEGEVGHVDRDGRGRAGKRQRAEHRQELLKHGKTSLCRGRKSGCLRSVNVESVPSGVAVISAAALATPLFAGVPCGAETPARRRHALHQRIRREAWKSPRSRSNRPSPRCRPSARFLAMPSSPWRSPRCRKSSPRDASARARRSS